MEQKGLLETYIITAITENVGRREVEVNIGANDQSLSGLWKCQASEDAFFQMLLFMNDDYTFTGRVHLTGEDDHLDMPDTLRRLLEREEDFSGSAEIADAILTVRQPFFAELTDMNTISMKSRSGQMIFSRVRYGNLIYLSEFLLSVVKFHIGH